MSTMTEDTVVTRTAPNPRGAALNATYRDQQAMQQHSEFFNSETHEARIDQVCDILEEFFEREVDYITARGLNRNTPFDNVKMQDVGKQLSQINRKFKWDHLYGPLYEMGDVDVISKNGHLLVRVYPTGKMPRRRSKNSVFNWYDV